MTNSIFVLDYVVRSEPLGKQFRKLKAYQNAVDAFEFITAYNEKMKPHGMRCIHYDIKAVPLNVSKDIAFAIDKENN